MTNRSFIASGLLECAGPAGSPRLLAGRHRDTGRLVFPLPDDSAYDAVALADRGTLWSYTVQRFRPKSPPYAGTEAFEPYAVGYVELAGQLIAETRLTGIPFEDLKIGMPLRLVTEEFHRAGEAEPAITYAFTTDVEIRA
ncbi:Zn-ribbon domain-containing OB-fold protein [Sphingomonas tabacisoli]|uniref:Zn-ribbon domain-containing OB-fold protein n=1 Tax=Sphingomonas tabacisoli TaxID=2249466 RepID=A0ABW4I0I1_9SPHN